MNSTKGLPYNGWRESVRHGRDIHYYHAQRNRLLKPATECPGCGFTFEGTCIPYHTEEYGPTLEEYWASCVPLCNRCHAMVHARFTTPNFWRLYMYQASEREIDPEYFPQNSRIIALLSKFKNRADIESTPMPKVGFLYFIELPLAEFKGAEKIATLLVTDQKTGAQIEVPDWMIYGKALEKLSSTGRSSLEKRGVDIEMFLSGETKIDRNDEDERMYRRLYFKNQLVRVHKRKSV